MSQSSYTLANAAGAAFRAALNVLTAAIRSMNSGASAPSETAADMLWVDTTNGVIKRRNAADSGWVLHASRASALTDSKSAGYTLALSDHKRLIRITGSGGITFDMTAVATLGDGWFVDLRNDSSGNVTLDPASTEQINGASTLVLSAGQSCKVWCTGSAFYTIGNLSAASSASDSATTLNNAAFAITVGSNAITIALKTKAGADPSASDPVTVGFRSATLTDGGYVVRTVTAALSLVVPSGATLGFSNSETNEIHIGFIDNAGTVELAVSQDLAEWTEGNVVSTTAIGTGSDSDTVLYSTSARTNVACRLAQVCTIQTGGTAGNWSNSPTVLRNVTNYGSAQLKNACQAWINFNGTGTVAIRDHFNVASLTDNGTGEYTVTFNVAQPDANYCVTGTAGEVTGGTNIASFISPHYNVGGGVEVAPSTTAVRFNTISAGAVAVDCKYVYLAVIGRGK